MVRVTVVERSASRRGCFTNATVEVFVDVAKVTTLLEKIVNDVEDHTLASRKEWNRILELVMTADEDNTDQKKSNHGNDSGGNNFA